jgi:hypothetical protein
VGMLLEGRNKNYNIRSPWQPPRGQANGDHRPERKHSICAELRNYGC